MRKKRSKPISVNIKVTYPKQSTKFKCQARWAFYSEGLANHHLKDGDELILCDHAYCQRMLCQEHMKLHQQEHVLSALAID